MKFISGYKLRIISWYTGLLALIVSGLFFLLNSLLVRELTHEVVDELNDKAEMIRYRFTELHHPSENNRKFFRLALPHRHIDFGDIRERIDYPDEKFLLAVKKGSEIVYLTKRFGNFEEILEDSEFNSPAPKLYLLNETPFILTWIDRDGYGVYLGYNVSYIYDLQNRYRRIFFMALPFAVFLSILCGYFVTQRSLAVIRRITKTARGITANNLHTRIKEPRGNDEINKLIQTLNSMIDRLEKGFNLIQQFSQDAAHEIRTPLTIIRGELEEILAGDECPEYIALSLDNILEEIQYLSSISNKLLLIHSMDQGDEFDFKELNLKEILKEVFEDGKVLSASDNKEIKLKLGKCDEVIIKGNRELIVRLLWNLIDNGIKYNKNKGFVELSLVKTGHKAVIKVKDTGLGIAEQELKHIFIRFYRIDKSRSRKLGGSGLGLSICKWIAKLHESQIEVESSLGDGTLVSVHFPLAQKQPG